MTIRRTLAEKLTSGWNELGVQYLSAPSPQGDRELIDRLARLEHLAPRPPRFLDATFFLDGQRQPDTQALRQGETYDLEVAIRVSPTGIAVRGKRESIAEPHQAEEASLIVAAEGQGGLTVREPVARLLLPPVGDSTVNARFRVTAEAASTGPNALAELTLRVFHQYSLLESVLIEAEIVSRLREHVRSRWDLEKPVTLSHDQIERGYDALEGDSARALHIQVSLRDSRYHLNFTWEGGSGKPLSLTAPTAIPEGELELILSKARRALLRVTMSDAYAVQLEPGDSAWRDALRTLAEAGEGLYNDLFRREMDSAIARISRLLKELPPPAGSVVQISVKPGAETFLFPWALIYNGVVPEEPELPDPDGFWGLRYCIEQRWPGEQQASAGAHVRRNPQRMAFMLWDRFPNSADHRAKIEDLSARYPRLLKVTKPPIVDAPAARAAMAASKPSDIYYFYAHAHAEGLDQTAEVFKAFVAAYLRLPDGGPAKEAFKDAYDRAVDDTEESSWIGLTYGRLKLRKLYSNMVAFSDGPLVFINACESAQLTPSLSGKSFVSFFLDRHALAVLGTESP